jgi:hypothetical protein
MPDTKSAADSIASLGSAITSPAKLVFLGYVILAATGKINTSAWCFFAVAAVFLIVQIGHDDYYRIVLNHRANLKGEKEREAVASSHSSQLPESMRR